MNSKALRLGLNRRHSIKADLEQRKNLVSDFLVSLLGKICMFLANPLLPATSLYFFQIYKMKNADPQTLSKVFKCLTSWWESSGIMTESDVRAPLLEGAFYVLQNSESFPEDTCEDASDWIVSLVSYCPVSEHLQLFAIYIPFSSNLLTNFNFRL